MGLEPTVYHLTNVVLHLASTVLIYHLVRQLQVPGALLAAAVFCLHPVMVESVAWITERKNVLSLVLALGSLLLWMRFAPLEGDAGKPKRWGLYAASLGAFVLALLSKSVTCSLPAVILLMIFWKRGKVTLHDLMYLLPFFVIGLVLALHTAHLEKVQVGAEGAEWEMAAFDRVLVAGRALWFYFGKLLWPDPLVFIYERWEINSGEAWQFLFPLAWAGLLVGVFLLRKRIGRGPVTALCVFSGVLVPALGFFAVYPHRYSFVADHFQYHASLAVIILLCGMAARFGARLPAKAQWGLAVLVLAGLGVRTALQTPKYADRKTLYESILAGCAEVVVRGEQPWRAVCRGGGADWRRGAVRQGRALLRPGQGDEAGLGRHARD